MHFGKALESARSPRFGQGYLEYGYLKKELKRLLQEDPRQLKDWIAVLEAEISRVDKFAAARVEDAKAAISQLSRQVGALKAVQASPAELARLESLAMEVSAGLVDLADFIELNKTAVSKIIKKHDKLTGFTTRAWVLARLDASGFLSHSLDGFLVALSDIYSRLRLLKEPGAGAEAEGGVWVPPESFERETTKYWIRLSDVYRLKMMLLRHLPLLVFGRDTSKFKAITPKERDAITDEVSDGWITSIYLDNDAHDCYHTRLARVDNAIIHRIRWYGSDPFPKPSATVFVERKTHHDKAVSQEPSVKERFPLRCSRVPELLAGTFDAAAYAASQVAGGDMKQKQADNLIELATEVGADVQARQLHAAVRTTYKRAAFQAATSNEVRISLDTDMKLVDEVLGGSPAGVGGQPFPPGRFCCDEAQMNRPGCSYDFPYAILEIKLQCEEVPVWLLQVLATGIAIPVKKFSKVLTAMRLLHPQAVTATPHWMSEDGQLLEPADKAAVAEQALGVHKIDPEAVPRAISDAAAALGYLMDPAGTALSLAAAVSSRTNSPRIGGGSFSAPPTPAALSLNGASSSSNSGSGGSGASAATGSSQPAGLASPSRALRVQAVAAGGAASSPVPSLASNTSGGGGGPVLNPLHAAAAANGVSAGSGASSVTLSPTAVGAPSPLNASSATNGAGGNGPATGGMTVVPNALRAAAAGVAASSNGGVAEWKKGGSSAVPTPAPAAAARPRGFVQNALAAVGLVTYATPAPQSAAAAGASSSSAAGGGKAKLYPANKTAKPEQVAKTMFANERTFLAWLQIALLLATISMGLMGVGSQEARNVAYTIAPVAFLFLLYAAGQYYRRAHGILHHIASTYYDLRGPGLLVFAVFVAMVANIGVTASHGGMNGNNSARRMLRSQQAVHSGNDASFLHREEVLKQVPGRCELVAAAPSLVEPDAAGAFKLPPLFPPASLSASASTWLAVSGRYGYAMIDLQHQPPVEKAGEDSKAASASADAAVGSWVPAPGAQVVAVLPHSIELAGASLLFTSSPSSRGNDGRHEWRRRRRHGSSAYHAQVRIIAGDVSSSGSDNRDCHGGNSDSNCKRELAAVDLTSAVLQEGEELVGVTYAPSSSSLSVAAGTSEAGVIERTLLLATRSGVYVTTLSVPASVSSSSGATGDEAAAPVSLAVVAKADVTPHLIPQRASADEGYRRVEAVAASAGKVWVLFSHGHRHYHHRSDDAKHASEGDTKEGSNQLHRPQVLRAYAYPSWEPAGAWTLPHASNGGDIGGDWTGLAILEPSSSASAPSAASGSSVGATLVLSSASAGVVWTLPLPRPELVDFSAASSSSSAAPEECLTR